MYEAKIEKPTGAADSGRSSSGKQFLYQREAAIWVGLIQSVVVMLFAFVGTLIIEMKFGSHPYGTDWAKLFSDALFWGWLVGVVYLAFWLWRWNKLAWLETALGVNLDRDPRIGNGNGDQADDQAHSVMYFKLERENGQTSVADFPFDPKMKRWIIGVASATVNNRPNSQSAMRQAYRMPRPKHTKVMNGFVKLGILEKEYPEQSNSKYVVAEPRAENMRILRGIANGDFEMLKDRWNNE